MQNIEVTEEGDGIILPPVDREEFELPATAYGAKVKLDKDGKPISVTLPKERVLKFAKPGKRIENKRIYTVKVVKPDGAVIQVALENQINNNVASPADFIGLRVYQRKGFKVLLDMDTGVPVFCPTWGCWAAANPAHAGFCSAQHRTITSPEPEGGPFGTGATTSQNVWRA